MSDQINSTGLPTTEHQDELANQFKVGMAVFDSGSGDVVTITQEMVDAFTNLQSSRRWWSIVDGVLLERIKTLKLYLVADCGSFKEYVDKHLEIHYRTARRRIIEASAYLPFALSSSNAAVIAPFFEEHEVKSILESAQVTDLSPEAADEAMDRISLLPNEKARLLAQSSGYNIVDFGLKKDFVSRDGETRLSADEISHLTNEATRHIVEDHAQEKRAWRAKFERLEQQNKKLKAEAQQDEDLKAENERLQREMDEIQNTVGERWADKEATLRALDSAILKVRDVTAIVVSRGASMDDPSQVREACLQLHKLLQRCLYNVESRYSDIIAEDAMEEGHIQHGASFAFDATTQEDSQEEASEL